MSARYIRSPGLRPGLPRDVWPWPSWSVAPDQDGLGL